MDAFEREYTASLLDEDPMPAAAAAPGGPPIMGVAAAGPFALKGVVLTPNQVIENGWVEIAGGTIDRVGTAAPAAGVTRIETDGVILPGLIDLHGHPEYNVFAAWEPPEALQEPRPLARLGRVRQGGQGAARPSSRQVPSLETVLTRYAEARALVAGTTAIQGSNGKFANDRGGARPQRRPTDLRPAQGALDHRPRPDHGAGHRDPAGPDRRAARSRALRPPRRGRRHSRRTTSSRS